jgi:hypothetical protein
MNAQGRHTVLGVDIFDGRTTVNLRPRGAYVSFHVVATLIEALGEAQGRDRLQMLTFLLCGGRMNHDGTYKSNAFRAVCKRVREGQMIFEFARTCAVETLNLSGNSIGNEGATALAAGMLQTNTTLETLELSENEIDDEGATALAGMLCTNTTLKKLLLYRNSIGNAGATALAGMLHTNTTLKTMYLSCNNIGADEKTALREAWGGRTIKLYL